MSLPFKTPMSMILSGCSQSGKTTFVVKLLQFKTQMFDKPIDKIYICYSEYQPLYNAIPGVILHEGVIDINDIDSSLNNLVIFDDLMHEFDERFSKMATKYAHHRQCSMIFITQNLFPRGNTHFRTMSLNANYLVLFKSPRDISQIGVLARQLYLGKSKYMLEAYKDATSKPNSYLLVDLTQDVDERLRLRARVFPDDFTVVYLSKI